MSGLNEAQERQVKAIAHTIDEHLLYISQSMQALQEHSLTDLPESLVGLQFRLVTEGCAYMQRALDEMLPRVGELRTPTVIP